MQYLVGIRKNSSTKIFLSIISLPIIYLAFATLSNALLSLYKKKQYIGVINNLFGLKRKKISFNRSDFFLYWIVSVLLGVFSICQISFFVNLEKTQEFYTFLFMYVTKNSIFVFNNLLSIREKILYLKLSFSDKYTKEQKIAIKTMYDRNSDFQNTSGYVLLPICFVGFAINISATKYDFVQNTNYLFLILNVLTHVILPINMIILPLKLRMRFIAINNSLDGQSLYNKNIIILSFLTSLPTILSVYMMRLLVLEEKFLHQTCNSKQLLNKLFMYMPKVLLYYFILRTITGFFTKFSDIQADLQNKINISSQTKNITSLEDNPKNILSFYDNLGDIVGDSLGYVVLCVFNGGQLLFDQQQKNIFMCQEPIETVFTRFYITINIPFYIKLILNVMLSVIVRIVYDIILSTFISIILDVIKLSFMQRRTLFVVLERIFDNTFRFFVYYFMINDMLCQNSVDTPDKYSIDLSELQKNSLSLNIDALTSVINPNTSLYFLNTIISDKSELVMVIFTKIFLSTILSIVYFLLPMISYWCNQLEINIIVFFLSLIIPTAAQMFCNTSVCFMMQSTDNKFNNTLIVEYGTYASKDGILFAIFDGLSGDLKYIKKTLEHVNDNEKQDNATNVIDIILAEVEQVDIIGNSIAGTLKTLLSSSQGFSFTKNIFNPSQLKNIPKVQVRNQNTNALDQHIGTKLKVTKTTINFIFLKELVLILIYLTLLALCMYFLSLNASHFISGYFVIALLLSQTTIFFVDNRVQSYITNLGLNIYLPAHIQGYINTIENTYNIATSLCLLGACFDNFKKQQEKYNGKLLDLALKLDLIGDAIKDFIGPLVPLFGRTISANIRCQSFNKISFVDKLVTDLELKSQDEGMLYPAIANIDKSSCEDFVKVLETMVNTENNELPKMDKQNVLSKIRNSLVKDAVEYFSGCQFKLSLDDNTIKINRQNNTICMQRVSLLHNADKFSPNEKMSFLFNVDSKVNDILHNKSHSISAIKDICLTYNISMQDNSTNFHALIESLKIDFIYILVTTLVQSLLQNMAIGNIAMPSDDLKKLFNKYKYDGFKWIQGFGHVLKQRLRLHQISQYSKMKIVFECLGDLLKSTLIQQIPSCFDFEIVNGTNIKDIVNKAISPDELFDQFVKSPNARHFMFDIIPTIEHKNNYFSLINT